MPIRRVDPLVERGLVPAEQRAALEQVAARYALAITPSLLDEIERGGDAAHALRRQFIPDPRELEGRPDDLVDPIGDAAHSPTTGLVHRHRDRVLLMPHKICPVYCRFCFRREQVGPGQGALSEAELEAALEYIRAHDEIWEVILTGGDPLVLSRPRLQWLLDELDRVPHVRVVRLHTRVPVVDPERVDDAMAGMLRRPRIASWVVVHTNHVDELGPSARQACARLVDAGVPLLSQSVLLAGVNDSAEALEELFRALVELRIKPYYLHHPDLAPGTAHFRSSVARGREIVAGLRDVSGLCRPEYVLDLPGGYGKVPLMPCPVHEQDGRLRIEDRDGRLHDYPPRPSDGSALPRGV